MEQVLVWFHGGPNDSEEFIWRGAPLEIHFPVVRPFLAHHVMEVPGPAEIPYDVAVYRRSGSVYRRRGRVPRASYDYVGVR